MKIDSYTSIAYLAIIAIGFSILMFLAITPTTSCTHKIYTGVDLILIHDYDVVDTIDIDEMVIYNYMDSTLYVVIMDKDRIVNVISKLNNLKKK